MTDQEHVKRQLRRLWLAEEDLVEAREFARLILANELHSRDKPEFDWELRAFNLAAVVSYARAFAETESLELRGATKYPPTSVIRCLEPEERDLHDRLLERRNQELAHSDLGPVELELELVGGEIISMSSVTRVPLTRSEAQLLLALTTKLLVEMTRRREALQAKLPSDVIF